MQQVRLEPRGGGGGGGGHLCLGARWTVNAKPRVSLAWPSRRPDHNAWSCRSQADHNHGDPTFPPSSLLRLSRRFAFARARLFPLNNPPVPPSSLSSHRSLQRPRYRFPRIKINFPIGENLQSDRVSSVINFSRIRSVFGRSVVNEEDPFSSVKREIKG